MKTVNFSVIAAVALYLSGCTTVTTISADLVNQKGVYIVGYTDNFDTRVIIEDQLAADLTGRGMVAYASHLTLPDITSATPRDIKEKAGDKQALGVIVLNRVAADASDSIVKNPARISPRHTTLQAFYSSSRELIKPASEPDQDVFVEVNLFIINGEEARLFWSGTTWTFTGTERSAAIEDISSTIADQLAKVRDQYK